MVNIEINGKKLQVPQGTMVIEAADEAGITIPRFCYHKKLSVAASCRMCLVEIEKMPKPVPACATPVTDGMNIMTHSAKALGAQKSVMEFLLINHPLDCPVCDQGGECELQDMAVGFGNDVSRYTEGKRVVQDEDIGPLIATEMTRCIHCTRCVRFGQEIAGVMELGATGRGEHMRIGTYIARAVNSELSGNVIDLCPVGALTSKPYLFSGRPWENKKHDAIAAHDCLGSNITINTRRNKVMRVLPRENEDINETWISDRDRFSYTAISTEDRLTQPMIKQGKQWKTVDWQTALNYTVEGLRAVIKKHGNPQQLGAWVSPSSTTEEMYLLQKMLRALGSDHIDHRLRQQDFTQQKNDPSLPWLGLRVNELEHLDAALLIGSCIRKDQPIAAHRLRKSALNNGSQIMAINAIDYDFNFPLAESIVTAPADMVLELASIAKVLLSLSEESAPQGMDVLLEKVNVNETHTTIAKNLKDAAKASVFIGTQAMAQAELSSLRSLANLIAELSGATLGYLTEGCNSVGAWLAGAVPHRGAAGTPIDNNVQAEVGYDLKAYINLNVEPEFDCASPAAALDAVINADFVVNMTTHVSDAMKAYADVLLPISTFAETSGSYVNAAAQWQSFSGSVEPAGEARPAWKVLRVLGNLFELDGFDYVTSDDIRDELINLTINMRTSSQSKWQCPSLPVKPINTLQRIGHLPIHAVDMLVRRSQALQKTGDAIKAGIYINSTTATQADLHNAENATAIQGDYNISLPVMIDDAIPDGCVMIPTALEASSKLGSAYGSIEIKKQ